MDITPHPSRTSSYRYRKATLFVTLSLAVSFHGLASEEKHWSYSGEDGPQQWGDLSADYLMCSQGRNQSPIDLAGAVDALDAESDRPP